MVGARDNEPHILLLGRDLFKCFNQRFQSFIRPPFAKGQNALFSNASACEVWQFRLTEQDYMGTEVHIVSVIVLNECAAVSRNKHGNGVRHQQQMSCHPAAQPVKPRILYAGVLQIHHVHDLVQRDMRVIAAETNQRRRDDATKSGQRPAAVGGKSQVEPHHVGLQLLDCAQKACWIRQAIERPAANHIKPIHFGFWSP